MFMASDLTGDSADWNPRHLLPARFPSPRPLPASTSGRRGPQWRGVPDARLRWQHAPGRPDRLPLDPHVGPAVPGRDAVRRLHDGRRAGLEREAAQAVLAAAREFGGPLGVRVEDRRQRPPRLHDLPSLQKLCSARFGWSASKTLEVAQELYDGTGKKILTYPRAEVRYLPESAIADVPKVLSR